jgi:hypothetical protein
MSTPYGIGGRKACKHFQGAGCSRGRNCPFAHVAAKKEAPQNGVLVAMLNLVFEKQQQLIYSNGVLALNKFRECPDLAHVASSIDFNTMAFCEALASVIKKTVVAPEFIAVNDNNIRSLHFLLKALESNGLHVSLHGISAKNNEIDSLDVIKQLRPFTNLKEIEFTGNPITAKAGFRDQVRKQLPYLLGIDGVGVHRPPLNLPWPQRTVPDVESQALLMNLEQKLFRALETEGVDGCLTMYHADAVFSLTVGVDALPKAPTMSNDVPRRNDIIKAFVQMRMAQTSRDQNLKLTKTVRAVRGRTDVAAALRHAMYPKGMAVMHELNASADVKTISEGTKVGLAIITFHGKMSWRVMTQPDSVPSVTRVFDRTVTLTMVDGNMFITNDLVHLRQCSDDDAAVWFADTTERLGKMARKHKLDEAVMGAIVEMSSSDLDAAAVAGDLQALTMEQLNECVAGAGGNVQHGIMVARVATRCSCDPAAAYAALQSVNMEVTQVPGWTP